MSDTNEPKKTISDFEAVLEKADTSVAAFEQDDRSFALKVREFLRANPTAIPAFILIVSILGFGLIADNFLKLSTLSLVLQQVTVTGVVAIAQTIVILTAGIDLAVNQVLVLSSLVMGKLAVESGIPVWIAIMAGLAAGAAMGLLNGVFVAYWRLPPFIVTLGTLGIFKTLKLWYSGSESIRASDIEEQAPFLNFFGHTISLGGGAEVTYGGIALIVLAFAVWYLLNRTPWGRHVHAVGDDPDAALLAGIQTNRILVSVYVVAGLICAIGAWISIGRVGTINPESFDQVNLDSITATVIGGTSLFGGRGSLVGSVLGALIVGVFSTGLSLAGVDSYWQYLTIGFLIILAVAVDQWLRRATQ
jgi:fructose transport system permease protein